MKIQIKCFPPLPKGRRHPGWITQGFDPLRHRKLKNNYNPFGCRGMAAHGIKKRFRNSIKRTPEEEKMVKDAREIKEMAQRAAPEAVKVIDEIMRNKRSLDAVRLAAANSMLDRAHGKATQTSVTATVNADGKPSEIDDKELTERIESALKRVERVAGGKRQTPPSKERSADVRKLH